MTELRVYWKAFLRLTNLIKCSCKLTIQSTGFVSSPFKSSYNGLSEVLSRVQLCVIPWTVAYQALLSIEFSKQEQWSGLPFPHPEDLPDPGIEPRSPALQADALPSEPPGKPVKKSGNCSVTSDSLRPYGLYSPWKSPDQNSGVGRFPFSRGSSQHRDRT